MHPTTAISPYTVEEIEAYYAVMRGKPYRPPEFQPHCPAGLWEPPDVEFPETMDYEPEQTTDTGSLLVTAVLVAGISVWVLAVIGFASLVWH